MSNWLRKAADALVPPANRLLSRAFDLNQLIAIYCCAKVEWPDLLGSGPRSGRFLASHANMSRTMTRRLLRACVVAGIFVEAKFSRDDIDDDKRIYSNTDMGDALRSNNPYSMKHYIQLQVEDMAPGHMQMWNALKNDSTIPFALAHGYPHTPRSFWRYFSDRPVQSIQFQKGMTGVDLLSAGALVHDFPWGAKCSTVVDMGGGLGSFLARVLAPNPAMRGLLFEVPSVVDQAEAYWADKHRDLLPRTSFSRGDFFDAATIPASEGGGTCFVLKVVLHDWDDASVVAILRNVAARMAAGGRVVVPSVVQVPYDAALLWSEWACIADSTLLVSVMCPADRPQSTRRRTPLAPILAKCRAAARVRDESLVRVRPSMRAEGNPPASLTHRPVQSSGCPGGLAPRQSPRRPGLEPPLAATLKSTTRAPVG
eukprot:CAMPEP_0113679096 /NCGR_PEP_ID=MMETSP0038_2-20120614/10386_1 /TAXON_ID=2898 /ORGANISM="Cryptomonas paramecium" /LENGTH=425 /DNA_ID=CAMNT_0000596953 /DNA_START=152 /DNA_END=1428 /DNA_ORIENTATION=+ /assembly_acc=CAM_ASM_000170